MRITPSGFAVLDADHDTLLSRWCENGGRLCHDVRVVQSFVPFIPVGGTVVDAGAAIGDHTIAYLEKVGSTGKVYAFEPHIGMFRCLQYNCPLAISYTFALGSERKMMPLHADTQNAGGSFLSYADEIHVPKAYDIPVIKLDALNLDALHFFKLDIEGMELQALKGAQATCLKFKPVIVLEANPDCLLRQGTSVQEIQSLLSDWGYSTSVLLGHEGAGHWEMIAKPHQT